VPTLREVLGEPRNDQPFIANALLKLARLQTWSGTRNIRDFCGHVRAGTNVNAGGGVAPAKLRPVRELHRQHNCTTTTSASIWQCIRGSRAPW
jgi:hypothetical protein